MTEPTAGPDLPFWRNRAAAEERTHETVAPDLPPASSYGGEYTPVVYQPDYQDVAQPTAHVPQFYVYPATTSYTPERERRGTKGFIAAVILAVLIVGGGLSWFLIHSNASHRSGNAAGTILAPNPNDPCITQVPIDVSDAGRQYLNAVAAATPAWEQVDATLASEGNITHRNDLLAQKDADAIFVAKLRAIHFPANVQSAAANLISIVGSYDTMLQDGYDSAGYIEANIAQLEQLDGERAQASSMLRATLNLPQSTCTFRRP